MDPPSKMLPQQLPQQGQQIYQHQQRQQQQQQQRQQQMMMQMMMISQNQNIQQQMSPEHMLIHELRQRQSANANMIQHVAGAFALLQMMEGGLNQVDTPSEAHAGQQGSPSAAVRPDAAASDDSVKVMLAAVQRKNADMRNFISKVCLYVPFLHLPRLYTGVPLLCTCVAADSFPWTFRDQSAFHLIHCSDLCWLVSTLS